MWGVEKKMNGVAKKMISNMHINEDYKIKSVNGKGVIVFNRRAGFSVFKDISFFFSGVSWLVLTIIFPLSQIHDCPSTILQKGTKICL